MFQIALTGDSKTFTTRVYETARFVVLNIVQVEGQDEVQTGVLALHFNNADEAWNLHNAALDAYHALRRIEEGIPIEQPEPPVQPEPTDEQAFAEAEAYVDYLRETALDESIAEGVDN